MISCKIFIKMRTGRPRKLFSDLKLASKIKLINSLDFTTLINCDESLNKKIKKSIGRLIQDEIPEDNNTPMPSNKKIKLVTNALNFGVSREKALALTGENISTRQWTKHLNAHLNDFTEQYHVQFVEEPFKILYFDPSVLWENLKIENPDNFLVISGDGRNLRSKGRGNSLESTIFGIKTLLHGHDNFVYLPFIHIWLCENKDTTPQLMKLIHTNKSIQDLCEKLHYMPILCADLKFLWILRGQSFYCCPWCNTNGRNRGFIDPPPPRDPMIPPPPQLLGIMTDIPMVMDVLHCYLRCYEGIEDLVQSSLIQQLRPTSIRSPALQKLYKVDANKITVDGKLRSEEDSSSHKRKARLIEIEIGLQNELVENDILGTHPQLFGIIHILHSLVQTFNTLMKMITDSDSDLSILKNKMKLLKTFYLQAREASKTTKNSGIFYFHILWAHVDEHYERVGKFLFNLSFIISFSTLSQIFFLGSLVRFATDEQETSHSMDKKVFRGATESKRTNKTALKMITSVYHRFNK